MRRLGLAGALAAAVCASGCLGVTPDEAARDALGPDEGREGPLHRPGQPCLLCHSEVGSVEPSFSVAGTVHDVDGVTGRGGVRVTLVDAVGDERTELTNEAGNFMVREEDWRPVFPLSVDVSDGEHMIGMRSPISIEGSCAFCHTPYLGRRSAGPVVVGALP